MFIETESVGKYFTLRCAHTFACMIQSEHPMQLYIATCHTLHTAEVVMIENTISKYIQKPEKLRQEIKGKQQKYIHKERKKIVKNMFFEQEYLN